VAAIAQGLDKEKPDDRFVFHNQYFGHSVRAPRVTLP
jgi:hypothetical protein